MALSAIYWLLALFVIVGEATADQQCFPQRTSSFKFRLTSYSNQTRHRIVKVGLESEARSEDQVILDVNHWTGMCGGAGTVGVQVDVTTPSHPPIESPLQTTATSTNTTTAGVAETTSSLPTPMPTPEVITREPVAGCWPKYELLSGVGCYKEVKENMSWEEAQRSCVAEGAHLAVPESQQQMDFFKQIIKRNGGHWPWAGIHKTGGQYISVQGSVIPLNSSFWYPGEPTGDGDCVRVWVEGFFNADCSGARRSICQQP